MKKSFVFLALAAVLAAGCAREQFVPALPEGDSFTKITVAFADSKLTLGDLDGGKRNMFWSKSDQIAANGFKSDKLVDSLMVWSDSLKTKCSQATFMFKDAISAPVEILYPASAYKSATEIELPDNTSYKSPKIVLLGKGSSLTSPVTLKSGIALLKTQFVPAETDPDTDRIRYIEVSSANTQLRGIFTPDYDNATLMGAENADSLKTIRQNIGAALDAGDTLNIYTTIPAGTYDIAVKVLDAGGHYMVKNLTGKTFEAGTIYSIPATQFIPTETEAGIEISDATAWNDFATAFNANPAENSKPVEITGDLDFLGVDVVPLGTADNGFPCTINGNDHSVSSISEGRYSLVYNLAESGTVKGLTVGDDCSFVAHYPDSLANYHCSPLVAVCYGTIENCENKASIIVRKATAEDIAAGCAVSHNYGGYTGGIVAYLMSGSKVRNCRNSGTITVQDDFANDASFSIASNRSAFGGIAGYGNADEISGCENNGAITVNYCLNGCVVGGISGGVTADYYNCINNGTILKANGTSAKNRSEYLAGINAYNWTMNKKYYDCVNNGNITTTGIFKTSYMGGITAYNTQIIDLKRCSNSGNIIADQCRMSYKYTVIGGLIGFVKYNQPLDLSGCSVTGELALKVTIKASSTADDRLAIGGVIGLCGQGATIEGNGFTITPNIHANYAAKVTKSQPETKDYLGLGAIVGANYEHNSGVKGKIIINNCKVDGGKVMIDDLDKTNTCKFAYNNLGIGGILGLCTVEGAEITGCDVNALVGASPSARNKTGNTAACAMGVGGISGRIYGGQSSITNCNLLSNSKIYALFYNSVDETKNCLTTGGILGDFVDTTATNTMTIRNCTVKMSAAGVHGVTGGVVGKAFNTTIENCSVDLGTADFSVGKSSAGIVGYLKNGSVSGCTALATATNALYCNYTSTSHQFGGGVVARANNSSFTDCKSFTNVFVNKSPNGDNPRNDGTALGSFAGRIENGCTFTNCSCGGTLTDNQGGVLVEGSAGTQLIVTISESNVNQYAVMYNDGCATPTFAYWDGK